MSGHNKPIRRVVIHMTVSPCEPGGARKIAAFFRSVVSGGSAHYVVDPEETVQVVYDDVIAEHAPPNPHSLGVEMCGYPESVWAVARLNWLRPNYRRMLRRTARLVAELLLANDLPAAFLPIGMRETDKGVTTHNNVSQTFHESTHWDPGVWPKRSFMRQVRKHMEKARS